MELKPAGIQNQVTLVCIGVANTEKIVSPAHNAIKAEAVDIKRGFRTCRLNKGFRHLAMLDASSKQG